MRWTISWALYWLGHAASKLQFNWYPEWLGMLAYRIYNRLMSASIRVQGDGDNGPWRRP